MGYINEIILSAEKSPFFHVQEGYYPDSDIEKNYQSSIERHLDRVARREEKNSKLLKCAIGIVSVVLLVLIVIVAIF